MLNICYCITLQDLPYIFFYLDSFIFYWFILHKFSYYILISGILDEITISRLLSLRKIFNLQLMHRASLLTMIEFSKSIWIFAKCLSNVQFPPSFEKILVNSTHSSDGGGRDLTTVSGSSLELLFVWINSIWTWKQFHSIVNLSITINSFG